MFWEIFAFVCIGFIVISAFFSAFFEMAEKEKKRRKK